MTTFLITLAITAIAFLFFGLTMLLVSKRRKGCNCKTSRQIVDTYGKKRN